MMLCTAQRSKLWWFLKSVLNWVTLRKTSQSELENNVRGLCNILSCQIHHILGLHQILCTSQEQSVIIAQLCNCHDWTALFPGISSSLSLEQESIRRETMGTRLVILFSFAKPCCNLTVGHYYFNI